MALEMKQSQRMSQDLRMTPQLQQAIKLLQLSRTELVDLIQNELVENPLLEESPDDWEEKRDAKLPDLEADPGADVRASEATPETLNAAKAVDEIDWERYLENFSSPLPASAGPGNDELPGYDQTLSRPGDLTDYLLSQLGTLECGDDERNVAEVIIGNLDEDGYFRDMTLEEFAEAEEIDLDIAQDGLDIVQELDPPGVGARDLAECLALQARILHPGDTVLEQVARNHLHDLERRNYAGIARALGVSRERVMDAHRDIMTFDPRPGRQFSEQAPDYIVPDLYIIKQDDDWVAVLNEDGLPRLRVSDYYRRTLRSGDDRDAKNYVQERLRSAQWLIRSIQQRQRTILRVAQSIIRFQRDFFDLGIDHLRPLVLRDVADDIGMHESTVSRVTTNKYVHTPRGIFELKFFFNSSIRKRDGDDVAAEAVKHRIKAIIGEEDPAHPLSDQKLVEILEKEFKIEIARRTVAKYREMLGILSSSRRRREI